MEKMKGIDKRVNLINELLQGIEFAKELRSHFIKPANASSLSSSSSLSDDNQETNFLLLEKLLSTFDKTISMAKLSQEPSINHDINDYGQVESPHSLNMSSPKSEKSHPTSKRRKSMMPKWSKKVKISNEGGDSSGLEGSLEDGFSWRKYGQKDILGAQFPRAYYRCTHRHSRNCAAIKQVQRSDEDTTTYQIMYIGEHTCTQEAQLKKAQLNPAIPAQISIVQLVQPPPSPQQEVIVGLGPEGSPKIESEQKVHKWAHMSRCFSFSHAFQEFDPIDDNNMLSICPTFGSPTTSNSCQSMSTNQASVDHVGLTVQTQDINDMGSGPNSVTNSPMIGGSDVEFSLDELLDFDSNFYFDFE